VRLLETDGSGVQVSTLPQPDREGNDTKRNCHARCALTVVLIGSDRPKISAGVSGYLKQVQRFFESSTVYAYIVVVLVLGLVFDRSMLLLRERIPALREDG